MALVLAPVALVALAKGTAVKAAVLPAAKLLITKASCEGALLATPTAAPVVQTGFSAAQMTASVAASWLVGFLMGRGRRGGNSSGAVA